MLRPPGSAGYVAPRRTCPAGRVRVREPDTDGRPRRRARARAPIGVPHCTRRTFGLELPSDPPRRGRRAARLRGRGRRPDRLPHPADLARGAGLRRPVRQGGARRRAGHPEDDRDRQGRAGGRRGVPVPAVQDARRLRRARVPAAVPAARRHHGGQGRPADLLPGRCRVLGAGRLHRHDAGDPHQPARGERRERVGHQEGAAPGVPRRWRRRHVHRRPGPARRDDRPHRLRRGRSARARGLRLRRRAARDVHARRRRHLHQGRGRRRRPRRQGRAGHPRGRPAQRRHDRRQRRRQRR